MKTTIVKACQDLGVHVNGSDMGPIKIDKFDNQVDRVIFISKENVKKETEPNNKKRNIKYVNEFNERLYNYIIHDENFIITLGGDHSIAISSALASQYKHDNLGIIWIDAHSDYHNMDSTITGNLHGMPLCSITGQNNNDLSYFHQKDYINPKNAVIIGARDIEAPELVNLRNAGVTIYTTQDIKQKGVKQILNETFDILKNTNGVHISYDLDVIDPKIAPGVSIPAKDGINENEAYQIQDELLKRINKIKSFDLVEYNTDKDKNNTTLTIANNILEKLISNIKE